MNAPAPATSLKRESATPPAPVAAGLISARAPGWDPVWENTVYGQGRHLNRYPHHAVVSFVFRQFGQAPDRRSVRICELGCGAGNNVWFAAREGFTVAGIDGSASAIEHARQRLAG